MINDPRLMAIKILVKADKAGTTLDQTLDSHEEELARLTKRDRSLANAIIFGTLRWRERLDRVISACSTRGLNKIRPEVLFALRTALFQIMFLERIPVSAAVNTAVNAAKKLANKGAAGFVNAVLRKASKQYEEIPLPNPDTDPDGHASAFCSIPLWLSRKWVKRYGLDKTLALGQAINSVPPITLRANTLKIDRESLGDLLAPQCESLSFTDHSPDGLFLVKPGSPIHEIEPFHKGLFQVQDEAAQLVTRLLAPKPGERILDACAGLGGKTGYIAQIMENRGAIVAADIMLEKLTQLNREMNRLGITMVTTQKLDLLNTRQQAAMGQFDRILLDAPCTGLGVLRRNPDTKWRREPRDITRLASQQQAMLTNIAELVRPGGTLVFAVCSCEPQENEMVIHDFLQQRHDFFLDKDLLESLLPKACSAMFHKGFFRTYPDTLSMDGFFAAVLKRRTD